MPVARRGQRVTLSWSSRNASTAALAILTADGGAWTYSGRPGVGAGPVPTTGSRSFRLRRTTTYMLTLINSTGHKIVRRLTVKAIEP